jgi:hypothetical protein
MYKVDTPFYEFHEFQSSKTSSIKFTTLISVLKPSVFYNFLFYPSKFTSSKADLVVSYAGFDSFFTHSSKNYKNNIYKKTIYDFGVKCISSATHHHYHYILHS